MFAAVRSFLHNLRRRKIVAEKRSLERGSVPVGSKKFKAQVLHKAKVTADQARGLESRATRKRLFAEGTLYPNQKRK